jgi:hypothetical protein
MQQFARVLTDKGTVPVIMKGNEHLDLRPVVSDITPDAIAGGALAKVDTAGLSAIGGKFTFLAPIKGVRQVAATGFNYKKHIEEFNMKPPTEPEVFLKAISSLTGPFDPISRGPNLGVKLDWETELAIVIGRETKDLAIAEAASHIIRLRLSERRLGPGNAGGCGGPATSGARQVAAHLLPHRPLSDDRHRCHESSRMDQAERAIRAAGQHQRHAVQRR